MAVSTRRTGRREKSDVYMDLIRRFPLKPVRNDEEHEQAVEIVEELMGRDLASGAGDYLDTLILLVNKYEDENHTPCGVHLTPQQALRALMTANQLTQADMGNIIGSESVVSMFLKGERGLSKNHIKALMTRFRIDAALFL